MSEKLKPCPCGKVPSKLILEEGATCKYAYCGGNCCGAWLVEFPTGYAHVSSYAAMELAIPAWNGAMRKELPTPERLARALWNCSRLRHGNFTTREFMRLCEEVLRAEMENADRGGTAESGCSATESSARTKEKP